MRYNGIGLAAVATFAIGMSLLMVSMFLWVYTFVSVGDACRRYARRLFRAVRPSQRILLVQVYDWIGIEHGNIKLY